MNHIVYDLEWDENGAREIVDIGAVKIKLVDNQPVIVDSFQSFVRPVKHHYTYFCEQFTGISKETIDASKEFSEVYDEFKNWVGQEECTFSSWGKSDHSIFLRNCNFHNIHNDFLKATSDVQIQVTKLCDRNEGNLLKLRHAMEMLGLFHERDKYHSALFDAECTAKVIVHYFNQLDLNSNTSYMTIKPKTKKSLKIKREAPWNLNLFSVSNKKQMAAWMEDKLHVLLPQVSDEIKQKVLEKVKQWEIEKEKLREKCENIFNSQSCKDAAEKGGKYYYEWINNNYPEHLGPLSNLHHGTQKDFTWRKHLYITTYKSRVKQIS